MGATDFATYSTRATVAEAYRAAVDEAVREYGQDSYNGTISTTSGAHQVVFSPMTKEGAALYANAHIEDAQKWGDALAIPVAEDKDFTFSTVKFSMAMPVTDGKVISEWELRDAAQKRAFDKYGDSLHSVTVTPKVKTKTIVESAKGNAVTRYEVSFNWGQTNSYDTKAQAVAAAKKMLESGNHTEVKVRAVKHYAESGSTAVTIKKTTVSATASVVVRIARPRINNPALINVTGWLLFGLAAC